MKGTHRNKSTDPTEYPFYMESIDYLKSGNPRQQLAWKCLKSHRIMELLNPFDPHLAGTIPIEIDIPSSDLDILCCFNDEGSFLKVLRDKFSTQPFFRIKTKVINGTFSIICAFAAKPFEIEIFGQPKEVKKQDAWRHMINEYFILRENNGDFARKVVELKKSGIKTELAFAKLLSLKGNPYQAILNYYP